MYKIHVQTHGCSVNLSESEIMKGLLKKAGFFLADTKVDADIIIINVCTVKGETTALREIKKISEDFPEKKLIIAGCITKELIREARKIKEDTSLVNTHNITKIVDVVEELVNGNLIEALTCEPVKKIGLPKMRQNPVIGIIPILAGCSNRCAYCSVKNIKGKLESYPKEDILLEAGNAVKEGGKELWITSQDNAAYGTEHIWRSSLPELLEQILNIEGNFKVRLGMMNPKNVRPIIDELINIYKNEKMFKFLHLPLQSGNDDILDRMRRGYSLDIFREMVNKFRREIPNITISSDIIVGFPGETVDQFNDSLNVVREIRPDILNISRFIARPGTEACYMKDKVIDAAIKDRTRILTEVFQNISRLNNERWLDWEGDILIDEHGKNNTWIGRNFAYKQVIVSGDYKLGQKIKVRIYSSTVFDLRGELLQK